MIEYGYYLLQEVVIMSGTYSYFAYDGTYEGFLCVAVKCINLRVFPAGVTVAGGGLSSGPSGGSGGAADAADAADAAAFGAAGSCNEICYVRTNYDIAEKMHNFLAERACVQVQQMVVDGFLTDMRDRERALIDLIARAVRFGACVADDYEHKSLRRIHEAILDLYREEQSFFVELDPKEYKDAKTAVIDPHNMVLPVMKHDIIRKTDHANLFIYDRRHNMVLFKKEDTDDIVDISRLNVKSREDVRCVYDSVWQYLVCGNHLNGSLVRRRRADYERLWYIAV